MKLYLLYFPTGAMEISTLYIYIILECNLSVEHIQYLKF